MEFLAQIFGVPIEKQKAAIDWLGEWSEIHQQARASAKSLFDRLLSSQNSAEQLLRRRRAARSVALGATPKITANTSLLVAPSHTD